MTRFLKALFLIYFNIFNYTLLLSMPVWVHAFVQIEISQISLTKKKDITQSKKEERQISVVGNDKLTYSKMRAYIFGEIRI